MRYSKEKKHSKRLNIGLPKLEVGIDKVLVLTSFLLFLLLINTLFFSDRSIFVLKEKIELERSLQQQVNQLSEENKRLAAQLEYLKNDNFYIEKKAREELGLMREGEEVYVLVGYEPVKPKEEISSSQQIKRWIDEVIEKYRQIKEKYE